MASNISVFKYDTVNGRKWGYRYEIASVSGKRKWDSKRGFATKGEAYKAGRDSQSAYENTGVVVDGGDVSYADFLDDWLNTQRGVLNDTTVENYEKKIRLYIKPTLGDYRIKRLSKDDIRRALQNLAENGCKSGNCGLSPNTMSVIQGIIKKSLQYAVNQNVVLYTPYKDKIEYGSRKYSENNRNPHHYLSKEVISSLFTRFPETCYTHVPLMFGYKCGMRIGEAFAVRWNDIDLNKKTLRIARQSQWSKEKQLWYVTNPKYNEIRTINLDTEMVELLKRTYDQQQRSKEYYGDLYYYYKVDNDGYIVRCPKEESNIELVTVRNSGEYVCPRTIQHVSKVMQHDMGYDEFDFHSLRHTHATMLVEAGATPMYIQHRLGHKNLSVTMRVYFHYTEQMDSSGAQQLEQMFNKEASTNETKC